MEIKIKRADFSDTTALYTLNTSFNGNCTTEELIADSLRNNTQEIVLIAYANEYAVGFLCGGIRHSMCYKTMHGEVGELYVEAEYRRKGIATKLIRCIEDEFIKMGILTVDIATSVDNHTAQAFYSFCGYTGKAKMIYRKSIETD